MWAHILVQAEALEVVHVPLVESAGTRPHVVDGALRTRGEQNKKTDASLAGIYRFWCVFLCCGRQPTDPSPPCVVGVGVSTVAMLHRPRRQHNGDGFAIFGAARDTTFRPKTWRPASASGS